MPPEESEAKRKTDPSQTFERFAFVNNAEAIYFPPEHARQPEIQSLKRVFNEIEGSDKISDEKKIFSQKFLMHIYLNEKDPLSRKKEFLELFKENQFLAKELDVIAKGGLRDKGIPGLVSAIKGDDGIWSILKSGDEDLEVYHPSGDKLAAEMIKNQSKITDESYIKGIYKAESTNIKRCYHVSFNTDLKLPNLSKEEKGQFLAATYEEIGKGTKKGSLELKDIAKIALSFLTNSDLDKIPSKEKSLKDKMDDFLNKFLGLGSYEKTQSSSFLGKLFGSGSGKTQSSKETLNLEGELEALKGELKALEAPPSPPPPATPTTVKTSGGTSSPPGPAAHKPDPEVIPATINEHETSKITTPDKIDVKDYKASESKSEITSHTLGGIFKYTENGKGIIKIRGGSIKTGKIPRIEDNDVLIFKYRNKPILFEKEIDFYANILNAIKKEKDRNPDQNPEESEDFVTADLYNEGTYQKRLRLTPKHYPKINCFVLEYDYKMPEEDKKLFEPIGPIFHKDDTKLPFEYKHTKDGKGIVITHYRELTHGNKICNFKQGDCVVITCNGKKIEGIKEDPITKKSNLPELLKKALFDKKKSNSQENNQEYPNDKAILSVYRRKKHIGNQIIDWQKTEKGSSFVPLDYILELPKQTHTRQTHTRQTHTR